jgi:alpha-1,2-mannosyltransferase
VGAGILVVSVAYAVVAWRYVVRQPVLPMVDLDVYRRAGEDVLAGRPVYGGREQGLVFTYPPFAAMVAVALTPFGRWSGQVAWSLATAAATAGVVWLSFRAALDRAGRWWPAALGVLAAGALLTHPLVEHVFYGQVNVFLVLACLLDCLAVRPRWPRGVLVGLAAAVKLTPGLFAVHLWLGGWRRPAVTAGLVALACTTLAWVLLPADSLGYWTRELWRTERIAGSLDYTSNQSLLGMATRLVPDPLARPVWVAAAVTVLILGLRRARAAALAGDRLTGAALVGLVAFLVSPISWIHHGVWFLPALGALAGDLRDRRRVALAGVVAAILLLRLPWWGWALLDHGPLAAVPGALLNNAYGLLAIGLVVGLPVDRPGRAGGIRPAPPTLARVGRAEPAR